MTITTAEEVSEQAAWDAIKQVSPEIAENIRHRVEMRQTAAIIARSLADTEVLQECFRKAASHLWRRRLTGGGNGHA